MRIAIFGNSGSGKTTLARDLCERHGLPFLELDAIVWEPGKIAVQRDRADIERDLLKFLGEHERWVVEGCYAELIRLVAEENPELIFLNPGEAICVENNLNRPWEPHKYASREAQDSMLENLILWVKGYYQRDDDWSLSAHRRVFEEYNGAKRELVGRVDASVFEHGAQSPLAS
jgi:adenylate kinase family enzyme